MKKQGTALVLAALLLTAAGCSQAETGSQTDTRTSAAGATAASGETLAPEQTEDTQTPVTDKSGNPVTQKPPTDAKGNPVTATRPQGASAGQPHKTTSGGHSVKPSGGAGNLVGNTYVSGFPIVKNKETISIMAITRPDVGDVAKSQFTKTYAKMTNMDIKWTLVTEEKATERKRLAIESGAMPDIFAIGGSYVTQADMLDYSATGAFVEITKDLLNTYGPHIADVYNDYPETWKLVTNPDDGKMYQIANFMQDYPYGQHYWWVRKTWLSNLGLSVPKTMDEFYDMLVAFRDLDPDGNGKSDQVPYATWSTGGFVTNPWGIADGFIVDKAGKVNHAFATDNMKKALTFWNKVYKNGLVDKKTIDNFAGENAAFLSLIKGGKVGCFFWGWPPLSDALMAEYEVMPWPTAGDNGSYPSVLPNLVPVPHERALIITKACKNVPAAIRFLDYLYTNDGYMLGYFGDNHKKSGTVYEPTNLDSKDILGPRWTLFGRNFLKGATLKTAQTVGSRKRAEGDAVMAKQVAAIGKVNVMPRVQKSKKEIQQDKLYTTYFGALSGKKKGFITGEANLSTDWTALQNEMMGKGLKTYLKTLQAYYDRAK